MPFTLINRLLSLLLCLYVSAGLADPSALQKIKIDITSHLGDQQQFQQGDEISFLLSLDKDAHIYVIYEDASGQRLQIIPNAVQPDNFYRAGFFLAIPGQDSAFRFIIQPPFGKETLWVFATDKPGLQLKGQLLENGLSLLKSDIKQIRQKIKLHSQRLWGEARFSLSTKAGG